MASTVEQQIKRFIKAVKEAEDPRKLHSILAMIPKDSIMGWTDNNKQDVLHYAIISGNAEATDLLLKMGFFAQPFEPQVNMYAHLAARLGFRAVMCTILQHRPEDFKVAKQPLLIPTDWGGTDRFSSTRKPQTKEPELVMPAVVGSQVHSEGKSMTPRVDSGSSVMAFPYQRSPCSKRLSQANSVQLSLSNYRSSEVSTELRGAFKRGSKRLSQNDFLPPQGGPFLAAVQSVSPSIRQTNAASTPSYRRESLPQKPLKKPPAAPHPGRRRFSSPEDSTCLMMDSASLSNLKPLQCTPLEVAARSKHVDCVKALLDMYVLRAHPDKGCKGYLTLAALANDVSSLKLLMEPDMGSSSDAAMREDFRTAVQVCVQNIYPECLELLLNTDLVNSKLIFKQINFFHVAFSQPFNTRQKMVSLARLPTLTNLLIKRGHDVKAKMPPRTYPLYSLIDNALSCHDFTFSECITTSMKMLLVNGADPNFDEVEFEQQLSPSGGSRHYGGRHATSSALHCIIQSLERNRDICSSKGPAIRFVEECVDILIYFKADIEKMGQIGDEGSSVRGDVLWQFARASVGLGMERGLLHCLTRFGAQPQRKISGQFALNVYLDTLCALLKSRGATAPDVLAKREWDINQMVNLMCSFMAPWHIKTVWEIFNYKHKKCTGDVHEAFKRKVNEALEVQSRQIHTLRTITAWQVWKLCKRKADNVEKLPVAKELKTHVLPLVLFQTLW